VSVRLALAFAILASCVYGPSAGGPEEPDEAPRAATAESMLPRGAHLLAEFHVDRLRKTKVGRTIGRLLDRDDDVMPELRRAEFDPLREIRRVLLAARFDQQHDGDAWFVALADHRLDRARADRVTDLMLQADGGGPIRREVIGGREIRRVPDEDVPAAIVVRPGLVALVAQRMLPTFLRDVDGRGTPDALAKTFRQALRRPPVRGRPFVTLVAEVPPGVVELDDFDDFAVVENLPEPAGLSLWASLSRGLEVVAHARYATPADARSAGDEARRAVSLEDAETRQAVATLGLLPIFRGIRVRTEGTRVELTMRLAQRDLDDLLARLELLAQEDD